MNNRMRRKHQYNVPVKVRQSSKNYLGISLNERIEISTCKTHVFHKKSHTKKDFRQVFLSYL